MTNFNKRHYPLLQLQLMKSTYDSIRQFVDENSHVLEISHSDELSMEVKDSTPSSHFKFLISKPRFSKSNNQCVFVCNITPANTFSSDAKNIDVPSGSVIKHLEDWSNIISQYREIQLTDKARILQKFEEEFFESIEIIEEDADINPFDLQRQIIIQQYIIQCIEILEKDVNENEDLIVEAEEIKDNLQNWTKRKTIRRLSRFFALARQKGLQIVKEFLIEVKKKTYKEVIQIGFDFITDIIP